MTLSADSADRIRLLYHAAKRNGSLVSAQELSRLLRESATASEVETAIATDPSLSPKFELRSGFLMERNAHLTTDAVAMETRNRRTAHANLSHASNFASLLRRSRFSLVAVSGSTSYGSASISRDADLFCVAPAGGMWISLATGLVMARAYSLVNRRAPPICLSCVMDENYARAMFGSQHHPLFARDALEAKVLLGRGLYQSLLRTAGWISEYFPVAYRTTMAFPSDGPNMRSSSGFVRALNRLLYVTVGTFIRTKSYLLNRRLRVTGRGGDLFRVRLGEDHLVYESRRYLALRKEYDMSEGVPSPLAGLATS